MTTTFTPNRNYAQPGTGDDVNSWGPVLNNNFALVDSNISGERIVTTTGGTTTLSQTDGTQVFYPITGALTSNAVIVFPFVKTFFFVWNSTTGAFTVTISAAGGGQTLALAQGQTQAYYSDGSNIFPAQSPAPTPAASYIVGEVKEYAGSTLPGLFLWANGSAVSRTTYSGLFAIIGTTYGVGDGSTTFNVPDRRGRTGAGADNMGGAAAANRLTTVSLGTAAVPGASGGNELPQTHDHATTEGAHRHILSSPGLTWSAINNGSPGWAGQNSGNVNSFKPTTDGAVTGLTVNSTFTGTSQNVQPTLVMNYIVYAGV